MKLRSCRRRFRTDTTPQPQTIFQTAADMHFNQYCYHVNAVILDFSKDHNNAYYPSL